MTINHGLYTDTVWAVPVTFRDTSGDPIDLSGYAYVAELVANAGVVFRFKSAGAAAGEGTLGLANAATGVIAFNASIAQHASVSSGLYRVHLKRDLADDVWAAEGSMLVGAPGAKETYLLFDDPGAEAAGAITYAQQAALSAASADVSAATATAKALAAAASAVAADGFADAAAASAVAADDSADAAALSAGAAAESAAFVQSIAPLSAIGYTIDNGGTVISTGRIGNGVRVPFACTITSVSLIGDVSGSVVVDIWKAPFESFPPTVANSICASAKPTLSSAQTMLDTTLTGWTKSIAAGDVLFFSVDSVSIISNLSIILGVSKYE